ncbi:MAG: flagellar biosynthesis anti-sigma factor FlgM [Deltaproteobacteria bacterium]|nr:flagellar biosynthesis anti-sigma factor FlgM [Deltaproteobacteria bacterium]MBW2082337.1 flagellar biosynthesis anti-sigma factor FlgM [Deltaproteobacteria bacterium]
MIENGSKESSIVNDVQENKEQDAKVEISDISIALDSVKEVMDKIDPERVAKVQAIKEAIVQGTYKVDSGAIADKILKDSLPNLVED